MSFDGDTFDTTVFDGEGGVEAPVSWAPARYANYKYRSIWEFPEEVKLDKNNVIVTIKK